MLEIAKEISRKKILSQKLENSFRNKSLLEEVTIIF